MEFNFSDLGKKAQAVAEVAAEKAKVMAGVAAEKAQNAAELAKINMSIASEQREMDKNFRTIGEWFVTEYEGEIPEAVRDLVDAVTASKAKIADLEDSKPRKSEDPEETVVPPDDMKVCPICGAASDSKFCPQCGAPMGE